jgi:methyltransferase (TIGR00027 family)
LSANEPLVRNISDTARWAAVYRARETESTNPLFRDPYARRLAGERGEEIAKSIPFSEKATWAWVARTVLYDEFITEQIEQGVDMVVNLAAGLDARPYRMTLPPALRWVEVDLPGILDYKEEILQGETPACVLERVRLDLSELSARRRELFARLGREAKNALIITEGLLIYLTEKQVGSLAKDLAATPGFERWVLDLSSPGLMRLSQKNMGPQLSASGAKFQFAPKEGPGFFSPFGWNAVDIRSPLKKAVQLRRAPFLMRLVALLPESSGKQGARPWSGICLFAKQT